MVSNRLDLEYDFLPATEDDLEQFAELCCNDFIKLEPHYKALQVTSTESLYLFQWLMSVALHHPYSLKVVEKETGKLVAIRTMSVGHRDGSKNWEPSPFDESQMSKKMMKMEKAIWQSRANFWKKVDPTVDKVLEREVSLVVAGHQRKGIAKKMLEMFLDFDQLRTDGIQGIVSEATSLANQRLLESHGYKCLYEYRRQNWAKDIDDGTTGIKVMFKEIRQK